MTVKSALARLFAHGLPVCGSVVHGHSTGMLAGGDELVQSVLTRPLFESWKHIVPLSGTTVTDPLPETTCEPVADHCTSQPQPLGPVWLATVYFSWVPDVL